MRAAALLVALVALTASPIASRGASAASAGAVVQVPSQITKIAEGCGWGYHWVGGHRSSATGRWIPGHCAHN